MPRRRHPSLQRPDRTRSPLVVVLPRQPGTKEARYAHTLLPIEAQPQLASVVSPPYRPGGDDARLAELESEVRDLRRELDQLKQQLADLLPKST